MSQQGAQFRVEFVADSRHRGGGKTTELITGLVDREERLAIRMAPYRNVQRCVHDDGRLVPEHPFHNRVVSHEIGNGRIRIPREAHDRVDVIGPIQKESPWRCSSHEIEHFAPWGASTHELAHLVEWKMRHGILKPRSEL